MNGEQFLGNIELFKCNIFQADTQNINNEINSKIKYINNENFILQNFKVKKQKKFYCRFCKNNKTNSKEEISSIPHPPNKPRTMKLKIRNNKRHYSLTVNSTDSKNDNSSSSSTPKFLNNNPKILQKRRSVLLTNLSNLQKHFIFKENNPQNSISIIADYLKKMPDEDNENNSVYSSNTPSKNSNISKTSSKKSSETTSQEKKFSYSLKYYSNKPVIMHLKRISKPGCRAYCGFRNLKKVRGGLGISVVSTSAGVLSSEEARRRKLGGEVLIEVF